MQKLTTKPLLQLAALTTGLLIPGVLHSAPPRKTEKPKSNPQKQAKEKPKKTETPPPEKKPGAVVEAPPPLILERAHVKLVFSPEEKPIPFLQWKVTDPIPTEVVPVPPAPKAGKSKTKKSDNQPPPTQVNALLEGTLLQSADWSLLINGKKVELTPEGKTTHFKARVPLLGARTPLTVHIVDPKGKVTKIKLTLEATPPSTAPRFIFQVGLGPSYVEYTETRFGRLNQIYLTGKVAAQYFFIPGVLDIGVNSFFTALPISGTTTVARSEGSRAWFLGVNTRLGYTIPLPKGPVSLRILGGAYWTNLFGTSPNPDLIFGFANMIGLQLFPNLSVHLGPNSFYAYFKFSPVFDTTGSLNFTTTREIAGGTGWIRRLNPGLSLSISLDIAVIDLDLSSNNVDYTVQGRSYSLGFGLGF